MGFRLDGYLEGIDPTNARDHEVLFMLGAQLEGPILTGAHFEMADLSGASGLSEEQLARTYGDAKTRLPKGIKRPAHWIGKGTNADLRT